MAGQIYELRGTETESLGERGLEIGRDREEYGGGEGQSDTTTFVLTRSVEAYLLLPPEH